MVLKATSNSGSGGGGTPGGSSGQVQVNNNGAFAGLTGITTASNALTGLTIGTLGYTDTGIFESYQGSTNSYLQNIIENTNSGATASADYVVNNNLSTATTYYGDFGMNSSGFTGSGAFNAPNTVFLTSTSGDLALGTTTSNAIHFVVNNGATDAATISSAGVFTINSLAATSPTFTGTGSATLADASTMPAIFTGGASPTAGNLYGIAIEKSGTEEIFLGINKNTTTGSIPANGVYLSTYTTTGTISIGRGNGAGLPNTADIAIGSTGAVVLQNTYSASTGTQSALSIFSTISQTSTAGYNGLYIAAYENTTGSASRYLINVGTSTAAGGGGTYSAKCTIDDIGNINASGAISAVGSISTVSFCWFGGPSYALSNLTVFQNAVGFSAPYGLFFGSTISSSHVLATGNGQTSLTTNGMTHSNFYVGSVTSSVSTGVNVPFISMAVIKSPGAITLNGTGTVTNTSSLYVEANAVTAGTNNYGLYNAGSAKFAGGLAVNRTAIADTAYTILISDYIVAYTSITAGRNATLPSGAFVGQQFIVKDESGNAGSFNITVVGTIDGATNKVINTAYGVLRVYWNGTNWSSW